MELLRDGSFTLNIQASSLARGMRPHKSARRNEEYLIECVGAVGLDGVLQVLEDISENQLDTAVIADGFPYPQIFVFTNLTLVCGETDIYEDVAGVLTHRIGPVAAGCPWSAVEFFDFIYMSNGVVTVVRHAEDGTFEVVTDHPTASAICNFNGQVLVGAPDVPWE